MLPPRIEFSLKNKQKQKKKNPQNSPKPQLFGRGNDFPRKGTRSVAIHLLAPVNVFTGRLETEEQRRQVTTQVL